MYLDLATHIIMTPFAQAKLELKQDQLHIPSFYCKDDKPEKTCTYLLTTTKISGSDFPTIVVGKVWFILEVKTVLTPEPRTSVIKLGVHHVHLETVRDLPIWQLWVAHR